MRRETRTAGKLAGWIGTALIGMCATGCATLTNGLTQDVSVSTDPPDAEVQVDGQPRGQARLLTLARARGHEIMVSKPGYESQTIALAAQPTRAIHANIWAGGLIGYLVDLITGAHKVLVPDEVKVVLNPSPASAERPAASPSLAASP